MPRIKKIGAAFLGSVLAASSVLPSQAQEDNAGDGLSVLGVIEHRYGQHYFSGAAFNEAHKAKIVRDDSYVAFGIRTGDTLRNDKVFEMLPCGAIKRWSDETFDYLRTGFSSPERIAGLFGYFGIQADPGKYDPAVMMRNTERAIRTARGLCDPQIS